MRVVIFGLLLGVAVAAGCDKEGNPTPTVQQTEQRVKEDLHTAGQEVKQGAATISAEVGPTVKKAGDEVREGIHAGADKVADWTATRP